MQEYAGGIAGALLSMEQDLQQEFETRFAESSLLAYRVAYGVLRNSEDAEDVAQEAFTKAYANMRQLRDREKFRAWLVRIAWRTAIDRHRANRRHSARETIGLPGPAVRTPSQAMLAQERAQQLWNAIDALPEKLRIVTLLAGIEEQNLGEVAALLELPQGTVKSRLFLARQRLKELLT